MNDLSMVFKRLRSRALEAPYRSGELRVKVAQMPCTVCHKAPPSDPHHVFGSVHGLKSSDLYVVPLCRRCHERIEDSAEDRHALVENLVLTLGSLVERLETESARQ